MTVQPPDVPAATSAGLSVRAGLLPRTVEIELAGVCNTNPPCVMCERNETPSLARPFISDRSVAALDAVFADAREVIVQGVGEPLLQLDKLSRVFERIPASARISINTNGTLLDGAAAARLVALRVTTVLVSVDAATAGTYLKIRRQPIFERVVGGISALVEARRAAGRAAPEIIASMTVMRENLHEVLDFVRLVSRLGADGVYINPLNPSERDHRVDTGDFVFRYFEQRLDPESGEVIAVVRAAADLAAELGLRLDADRLAVREAVREPFGGHTGKLEGRYFCLQPWDCATVDITGGVRACHRMKGPGAVLGNLEETPFAEIWRGARLERIRRDIRRGVMPPECGCVDLRHPRPEVTLPYAAGIALEGARVSADGAALCFTLALSNEGSERWRSGVGLKERVLLGCLTNPVRAGRSADPPLRKILRELPRDVPPGGQVRVDWELPREGFEPGVHILRFDLMHRSGRWFDASGQSHRVALFATLDASEGARFSPAPPGRPRGARPGSP